MHGSTRKLFLGVLLTVLCLALFVPAAWAADGDVTLTYGPTPIENGSCLGAGDITVENGLFAVSFAVDSTPPWGVPKGSILDGATYDAAGNLNDRLTLVDFLPNGCGIDDEVLARYQPVERSQTRLIVAVSWRR